MNKSTLTKKEAKRLIEIAVLFGRIDELERQQANIPQTFALARKTVLERQLKELLNQGQEEQEEIQINITVRQDELENKRNLTLSEIIEKKIGSLTPKRRKPSIIVEDEEIDLFGFLEREYPKVYQYFVKR